jgi:hypothetical protein
MSPAVEATRPASLVGLRCRISEPGSCALGVEALVHSLAARLDIRPRLIGTPPPPTCPPPTGACSRPAGSSTTR